MRFIVLFKRGQVPLKRPIFFKFSKCEHTKNTWLKLNSFAIPHFPALAGMSVKSREEKPDFRSISEQ